MPVCNMYYLSSLLIFWRGVFDTTWCDKVCQWLASSRRISLCTPVSSTKKNKKQKTNKQTNKQTKIDRRDITEILLKVVLITMTPTICFALLLCDYCLVFFLFFFVIGTKMGMMVTSWNQTIWRNLPQVTDKLYQIKLYQGTTFCGDKHWLHMYM